MSQDAVRISKRMSYALRHDPASLGLNLDEAGWCDIADLANGLGIGIDQVLDITANDTKSRFTVANSRIRAAQGHSFSVELDLVPRIPPAVLFHGTPGRNVPSILSQGLTSGKRQFVHLSATETTAQEVGNRRGEAVVLRIDAESASNQGITFFQADNGVWLVLTMPAQFISLPVTN